MKTKRALKLIKEILVLANELQEKQNVMKAVSVPIPKYKDGGKNIAIVPTGLVPVNEVVLKDGYSISLSFKDKNIFDNGCILDKNGLKNFLEGFPENKSEEVLTGEESLFEIIKNAVDSEKLFIVNEYGEKSEIKLSHSSGSNVFFKHLPNYNKPERTKFSEVFEKVKAEDPVLKEAYDEIEKSMPFAHPESEPSEKYREDHFYQLRGVFSQYTQEQIKKDPILKMRAKLVLIDALKQIDVL